MLAAVKVPHIEMSLGGNTEDLSSFIAFLRKHFDVEVLLEPKAETLEEGKPFRETEAWKSLTTGDLLAGARLKHRLTQAQLAEKSGIHQVVISAYETGRRKLTMKAAIRLAKALDEKPERLFKN